MIDGTCQLCPSGTRVAASQRACEPGACSKRQILETDGSCTDCPEYQWAPDGKTCRSDPCKERQRLKKDGRCAACDDYARQQFLFTAGDQKKCGPDPCSDR